MDNNDDGTKEYAAFTLRSANSTIFINILKIKSPKNSYYSYYYYIYIKHTLLFKNTHMNRKGSILRILRYACRFRIHGVTDVNFIFLLGHGSTSLSGVSRSSAKTILQCLAIISYANRKLIRLFGAARSVSVSVFEREARVKYFVMFNDIRE